MVWDVFCPGGKNGMDVMYGMTKTAWDVLTS